MNSVTNSRLASTETQEKRHLDSQAWRARLRGNWCWTAGASSLELATVGLPVPPSWFVLREEELTAGARAAPELAIQHWAWQRLGEREGTSCVEAGRQASGGAPIWGLILAARMASLPEASLLATLLILTVVLSTVLAGNSVDVVSSSSELLASSSLSPASPRPTTTQLLSVSSDLTTVCMQL
jgi:hypothetical protein